MAFPCSVQPALQAVTNTRGVFTSLARAMMLGEEFKMPSQPASLPD